MRDSIAAGDYSAVLEYDGDINEADSTTSGYTAVRYALMAFDGVTHEQRQRMLDALLTKGANFLQGWKDFPTVVWAAHDPALSVDVLRWLVENAGVDVNECDRTGAPRVAVQHALCAGSTAKVEYLMGLPQLDVDVLSIGGKSLEDLARAELSEGQREEMLSSLTASRVSGCDVALLRLCPVGSHRHRRAVSCGVVPRRRALRLLVCCQRL